MFRILFETDEKQWPVEIEIFSIEKFLIKNFIERKQCLGPIRQTEHLLTEKEN